MDVLVKTHIKGGFNGWSQGAVFVLAEGNPKKWRQVEDRYQFRSIFRPKARLLRDSSKFYLEVEGMDDMVEVERE